MDVETIQRLLLDASSSESFERISPRSGVWDISRGCEKPIPVTHHSRATGLVKRRGLRIHGAQIVLLTPCRNECPTCLRRHGWLWSQRAKAETDACPGRTWFVTLTTTPQKDFWIDSVASMSVDNFGLLPHRQKFAMRAKVLGAEVTKYLKRVRKNTGVPIRYLLVCEIHDSAETSPEKRFRPHMHLLVHESAGQPIRKRQLLENWHHGFGTAKLVNGEWAAWYVTKYISKASLARVRPSLGYGNASSVPSVSEGIYTSYGL